jgi:hypothetical protein
MTTHTHPTTGALFSSLNTTAPPADLPESFRLLLDGYSRLLELAYTRLLQTMADEYAMHNVVVKVEFVELFAFAGTRIGYLEVNVELLTSVPSAHFLVVRKVEINYKSTPFAVADDNAPCDFCGEVHDSSSYSPYGSGRSASYNPRNLFEALRSGRRTTGSYFGNGSALMDAYLSSRSNARTRTDESHLTSLYARHMRD